MKKFLLVAIIIILITSISLSGCEEVPEEKPNYKYVTVYGRAIVADSSWEVKVPNMEIEIEILKTCARGSIPSFVIVFTQVSLGILVTKSIDPGGVYENNKGDIFPYWTIKNRDNLVTGISFSPA